MDDLNPLYYRLIKLRVPTADEIGEYMENGEWTCTQCGNCCRSINTDLPPHLHHMDRGDGVCKNLDEDNQCRVYENRPRECRLRRWPNDDLIQATFCARITASAPDVQDMRVARD